MTNEELLAGFLDRSLSEDDRLEFEARRNSQPEFSKEINQLRAVEDLLASSGVPKAVFPIEYLQSVEQAVSANVVASAGAGTAGFMGSMGTTAWAWIAGIGVTAVGATAIYVATNSDSTTKQDVRVTTSTQSAVPTNDKATPTSQPNVMVETESNSADPKLTASNKSTGTISAASVARPAAATRNSHSSSETMDVSAQNDERALNTLIREFEQCMQRSNDVRCAQMALTIGKTLRESGNNESSANYLYQSLAFAKSARIMKYQVDALGELGLTAVADGRNSDAKNYIEEAISVGMASGVNVDRWTRLLSEL